MFGTSSQGQLCDLLSSDQVRTEYGLQPPLEGYRSRSGGRGASSEAPTPLSVSEAPEGGISGHLFPVGSPENPHGSPLVYAPYQHTPLKHWSQSSKFPCKKPIGTAYLGRSVLREEPSRIEIYPHGFSYRSEKLLDQEQPDHLKQINRGEITGFSKKSASRLREFMLTHHKEGAYPFAVSLTTNETYTPEQWESIVKRFRTALSRNRPDWAACWRVELQRRQTPHLHCVFWMDQSAPAEVYKRILYAMWIKATREPDSGKLWKHSVCVRDISDHDAWMIYCTLHDSKAKKAQLGWKGRQWGIWNRKAWDRREPLTSGEMTKDQRISFMRRLRAYTRRRYKGKLVKPLRVRYDGNLPAYVCEARIIGQLLRGIVSKE